MTSQTKKSLWLRGLAASVGMAAAMTLIPSCARVAVEGGEKPIHIVMDVNLKVDRELDNFFDFEKQPHTPAASQPAASAPATAGS
jgi:hypothetical protein